jgi:hypothetical protein
MSRKHEDVAPLLAVMAGVFAGLTVKNLLLAPAVFSGLAVLIVVIGGVSDALCKAIRDKK